MMNLRDTYASVDPILTTLAQGYMLPEEVIENAGEGPAQVDLRAIETRNAMSRLMNAYEVTVADKVGTLASYEAATATQIGLAYGTWTLFAAAAGPTEIFFILIIIYYFFI